MIAPTIVTYTAFALLCLALLILPFVPALREWRRPTDLAALPVLANYTSDIDHFARRMQADATAKLGEGPSTGFEDFELVTDPLKMDWDKAGRRLISQEIESAGPISSRQQLYVQGSIRTGAGSSFPALYATGDIDLGAQSEVRDWAHAGNVLRLQEKSAALRRVSAGTAIELGNDSWFERMHAPTLYFGSRAEPQSEPDRDAQIPATFADLPGAIQQTPMLFLVRGDCALPAGRVYRGSLVVTGFLTIGAGTTVSGDIKARDGVSVGYQAAVEGALTCDKRVYLFHDARVLGPVISESDILIGARSVVGLPAAQTTVSALNIIVEDGVVVHGTIWAHEIGMVKAA